MLVLCRRWIPPNKNQEKHSIMKKITDFKIVFLFFFLIVLSSCSSPQKEFEKISSSDFQRKSTSAFNPHNDKKIQFYERSVELYKKAGKTDHADWLTRDNSIKDFKSEEIESEWRSEK